MQEPMLKVAPTQCATLESLHLCTSMLWIYANDEWIAAVGCALHGWLFCGQSVNSLRLDQRPLNRQYVLGRTEPKPSLAFLKCRKTTPTQMGKDQDAKVKQQCFKKRLKEDL